MKIKELLSDSSKFTRGTTARKSDGSTTTSNNPEAVSWSLMGALRKCYGDCEGDVYEKIFARTGNKGLMSWANDATWEEVKSLLEELDV